MTPLKKLKDISSYCTDKILKKEITSNEYISTTNMLADMNGVELATYLPPSLKLNRYEPEDILIANIRPYFKKIWQADKTGGCDADVLNIRANKKEVLPEFLYYALFRNEFFDYIMIGSKGVKMPRGDKDFIMNFEIPVPSFQKQEEIVSKIKPFFEKIDSNNILISNFEDYLQLLFHKWFVDFNFPDENGNPYKDSGGEMVEVYGKIIPKGWNIKTIKECTKHIKTGLNPRDNFTLNNGNIKYITVKNLSTSGAINFDNCDTVDEQAKILINKRSDVQKGDILFASISPLGRCAIVHEKPNDWVINESVFSIRPNLNLITSEFLFLFLTNNQFVRISEHKSAGSIFKGIRIKTLEDTKLVLPSKNIIDKFQLEINNLLTRQHSCHTENQLLKETRDLLIKKLIK